MKIKLPGIKQIKIRGDYIRLDALLKFSSIASTGGEAKILINSGEVFVGGEPCTSRGKKIRSGDVVRYDSATIVVASKNTEAGSERPQKVI